MDKINKTPEGDAISFARRQFFQRAGMGVGGMALASMLASESRSAAPGSESLGSGARGASPMAAKVAHFAPKAKSVIYLHMVGAPSHLDLYDYKPQLQKRNGEKCPDEFFKGKQLAFIRDHPVLMGTPKDKRYAFRSCGDSGHMISNLMPNLQTVADDLCFVKTLHTEQFNHAPAQMFLLTGFGRFGRPSIGSWVTYGLGSENQNLPGFVVMVTGSYPGAGNSAFGSGFLPSVYQGVEFRSQGDPVLYLSNPNGVSDADRRRIVNSINKMNRAQLADIGDPEIATRINQYELAYRMQSSVPELMDIKSEPKHIHDMYGTNPGRVSFANNCLLARRLVERGVRFVQLFDQGWDHHGNVFGALPNKCKQVDQPITALLKDLKERGLLDETLVVWSGEFGRTPMAQGKNSSGSATMAGRDHHKEAYTIWMAGGGTKGGSVFGETDELGYGVGRDGMHVHDLNATILHLLGMDHEKLTFRFQGRPFRLTDIAGEVAKPILA